MKLMQIYEELRFGHKERVHITYHPVETIKDMTNSQSEGIYRKPKGFWYSFGSAWINKMKNFVGKAEFTRENRYGYKVYVDTSKIFVVNSKEDLDFINKNYPKDEFDVDWVKFAQDYNGIEIPSIGKLNVNIWGGPYSWLSTWDVSSGCIWNPESITKLKKL